MEQKAQEDAFLKITNYVEQSVFSKLPQHLYYHNKSHTLLDVLPVLMKLAKMESVNDDNLFLLKIAALFHDTGFIRQYFNNEKLGAEIAKKTLGKFDLSKVQIDRIQKIVLATRVSIKTYKFVQMAGEDILEKIICDADLDNLGRVDFFEKSINLRKELSYFGNTLSDKDWIDQQVHILESHKYLTNSAQKLRNLGQSKNLEKLRLKQKAFIKNQRVFLENAGA